VNKSVNHWIVVANGARAAIYQRDADDEGFTLVSQFAHAASRAKGAELVSDRPGAVRGHGSDSAQYVPHVDPKRNEIEHFAGELAGALEHAFAAGRFGRLTLVVSNPFLGVLGVHLAPRVRAAIDLRVPHDYTGLSERELKERLVEHLNTAERSGVLNA